MTNIVIMGATGGIGSAIAKALAHPENHLMLLGRKKDALQKLARTLDRNTKVSFFVADLARPESLRRSLTQIKKSTQKVDWLIYAAGTIQKEPMKTVSYKDLADSFAVNLNGLVLAVSSLRGILSSKGGVIAISSTSGLWGNGLFPIYSSSKAALNMFMQSEAKSDTGSLRYITLCPGPTNTAMRERVIQILPAAYRV